MEEESSFVFPLEEGCVEYELQDEQRLEGMCRVCASSDCVLMPVFDSDGQSKGLVELINNHLPILVTPTDLLPVSICTSCFETLTSIHSLVEVCVKANEKMQLMLQNVMIEFPQLSNFDVPSVNISDVPHLEIESPFNSREEEEDEKITQQNSSIDDPIQSTSTVEANAEVEENGPPNKDKKLYRCLHCDLTDSDAYLLLLHQIKSHPGKFLKCSFCDFVYSADQKNKYNEHLKLHSLESTDSSGSFKLHIPSEAIEVGQQNKTNVETRNILSSKGSGKGTDKVTSKRKSSSDKRVSSSIAKHTAAKKEIYWRCGFCGMKAKSKIGLIDHCNLRHKERLGLSFLSSNGSECFRCKQTFGSEIWLKDHLCHSVFLPKAVPSPKQMSCLTCPMVFSDVNQFREHLLSHTNSVKCHICGAHFRSQLHLQSHIDKHKNKPSLQCPHCPRNFKLKSRLKIHLRTHTGERPYMCVKCGKQFSTDSGFRLHMAAHEGKKPYICSLCGQPFNRPSNLRRHESVCGGSKLHCRICKEKCSSREEMNCHLAMHSKEEREAEQSQHTDDYVPSGDKFSCKVCGMKFDRVIELSQHRHESHSASEIEEAKKAGHVDGGAYVCPECGKEVYNKRNYERHIMIHSGNTQYQCSECSNIYSTKFALEYHMLTHTGERPYKCDLCTQGFKTRISLRVHRMKHTGEKPYKCRTCSMGFITAASLRLHLVTHSDSRMFPCTYCPATFKRKKTLVTHVRIHTGEKPYVCKFCGRRFTQKGACSQHEKTHSEPKSLRLSDSITSDMSVTVIKNWRNDVTESFPEDNAGRMNLSISQDENSSPQTEEVQHMVLIQQDVDCVIGEPDLMEISEEMVLQSSKHTIIIEQDGILADAPIAGLKDANSDPQMPVLDE